MPRRTSELLTAAQKVMSPVTAIPRSASGYRRSAARAGRFIRAECPLGVRRATVPRAVRLQSRGFAGTSEAADGTRSHDLLHGNQKLSFRRVQKSPAKRQVLHDARECDDRGLLAIRGDL